VHRKTPGHRGFSNVGIHMDLWQGAMLTDLAIAGGETWAQTGFFSEFRQRTTSGDPFSRLAAFAQAIVADAPSAL